MIQLTGPVGAGKSTVGAALAARLACPFLDLDREFERRNGDIDLGRPPRLRFFAPRAAYANGVVTEVAATDGERVPDPTQLTCYDG